MKKERNANGFKIRLAALERQKRKLEREIEQLRRKESKVRARWTKEFHKAGKAAVTLTGVKKHGTKRKTDLSGVVLRFFTGGTASDTKERDSLRAEIRAKETELTKIAVEIGMTQEQERSETKANDELVAQVFALNDAMVKAVRDRDACLDRHVYPRLHYGENQMHGRYTFTSANGLQRVVAMVNSLAKLKPDLAREAKELIDRVFAKFKEIAEVDEKLKPFYELTKGVLVERTDFKVGPGLSTFLKTELDPKICPELVEAKRLLMEALTYEKTSSYVRLYERTSRTDPWTPVPQS